jgi:phosphoglycerate kinase
MGVFEMRPFAAATFALADVVAGLSGATTIVGGGDSAAAIEASGDADGVDWISTGGGAMLTFLAGEPLPAVEALLRHA